MKKPISMGTMPLRFEVWVVVGHDGGKRVGAFRDAVGTIEVIAEPDEVARNTLEVMTEALDVMSYEPSELDDRTSVLITDTLGPRLFEFTQPGGHVLQFRRVGE